MIYKYIKTTDQYTTYTVNAENCMELSTIDGWTYVMVPGIDPLPEQSTQVAATLESVNTEEYPDLLILIKTSSPVIKHRLDRLNVDVNKYIISHYDTGTQNSFNGLYSKRSTPDAVRDQLDLVWDWIEAVMGYYYTKKQAFIVEEVIDDITWDFSQFDATVPEVTLAGLMTTIAGA